MAKKRKTPGIKRGHAFGRPGKGRSTTFKDKSKYNRKTKKKDSSD
jgi:hypothetical protein